MTLQNTMVCDCGEEVEIYETEIPIGPRKGEKTEIKKGCKCEDIRLARQARETENRLKTRKMQEIFDKHSLINKDLQQASFSTYEAMNQSQAKAKRIAERFVEVFDKDNPKNLLFCGAYGVGKSHLAKSITDEVMKKTYTVTKNGRTERRHCSAVFISVPKLLTKFRTTYNKSTDYSEGDLIEMLNRVDVLVLDDLGAEKSTEWAWEKLFEIIDSRQGLHTIYTSNYVPDDLINRLGERNFSRVVNRDTTVVEIDGDNYRLGNFAQ